MGLRRGLLQTALGRVLKSKFSQSLHSNPPTHLMRVVKLHSPVTIKEPLSSLVYDPEEVRINEEAERLLKLELEAQALEEETPKTFEMKLKEFIVDVKKIYQKSTDITKRSFIKAKEDIMYLFSIKKKNKEDFTILEFARRSLNFAELTKFMPIAILIILPFTDELVPVYLWLMPSMIPIYFIQDDSAVRRMKAKFKAFKQSRHFLLRRVESTLAYDLSLISSIGTQLKLNPNDPELRRQLKNEDAKLVAHFLENWEGFYADKLDLKSFTIEDFEAAFAMFSMRFVSGFHIMTKIRNWRSDLINSYNVNFKNKKPTRKIIPVKIRGPLIDSLRCWYFRYRFRKHFKKMQVEEEKLIISPDSLEYCDENTLKYLTSRRGYLHTDREVLIDELQEIWVNYTGLLPIQKFWVQVIRSSYVEYLISRDKILH